MYPGAVGSEAAAESPPSRCAAPHHQAAAEPEEPVAVAAPGLEPAGITVDLTSLDDHRCEDERCDSTHTVTDVRTEKLPELSQRQKPPEDLEEESHEDPEAADPGCIVVEEYVGTSSTDAAGSPDE